MPAIVKPLRRCSRANPPYPLDSRMASSCSVSALDRALEPRHVKRRGKAGSSTLRGACTLPVKWVHLTGDMLTRSLNSFSHLLAIQAAISILFMSLWPR